MLDAEHTAERVHCPAFCQLHGLAAGVWRVSEHDVEFERSKRFRELERGFAVNRSHRGSVEGFDVCRECAQAARILLDEIGRGRATGKCFEAESARAGVEIEHLRRGKVELEDAHPRLAHAVEGGSNLYSWWGRDASSAPPSCDYAHGRMSATLACSRLSPRYSSFSRRNAMSTHPPGSNSSARCASPQPIASIEPVPVSSTSLSPSRPIVRGGFAMTTLRARSTGVGLPIPNGSKCRNRDSSFSSMPSMLTSRSPRTSGIRSSGVRRDRATSLNRVANASTLSRATVTPAAARCPPNRSSRSLALPSAPCRSNLEIERPKLFDESGRNDPDHARMPRLVSEDDAERIVQIHLQHPLPRLVEGPAVNLLPLVIQLLQLARDRVRLVLVFSEKQLDTADRVAQP